MKCSIPAIEVHQSAICNGSRGPGGSIIRTLRTASNVIDMGVADARFRAGNGCKLPVIDIGLY